MRPLNRKQIGELGEGIAKTFLIEKGLLFLEQNFYAQGGEIDLIMKNPQDGSFVFVEVKTRRSQSYGYGEEAITTSKLRKIMKAASAFFFKKLNLSETPYFQIDAIVVSLEDKQPICEHFEDIGKDRF